jgi:hypothetical protein
MTAFALELEAVYLVVATVAKTFLLRAAWLESCRLWRPSSQNTGSYLPGVGGVEVRYGRL